MRAYETYLTRWRTAGLLDEPTERAIRVFESEQAAPAGRRWQVVLALILGGILLGAGVLLFVAAHWDDVSPGARLALVVGMLGLFHGAGIFTREEFPGFATAMHALGTVVSGAGIALVGQIFNMQEHWPGAVMLWAGCALAGWALLRDQFQQTLAMLLVPAWIVCEWQSRATGYSGSNVFLGRMIAVIAAVYLTAWLHTRRRVVFGILFAAASLALAAATVVVADGWTGSYGWGHDAKFLPLWLRLAAYGLMVASVAFGGWLDRQSVVPALSVGAALFAVPWLQVVVASGTAPYLYRRSEPNVAMYAVVAAMTVLLAWWGVRQASRALVNYGIAAFALTVLWFYFSDILGKLDRSLGLIVLGVLFLGGGWGLEMARRRLIGGMAEVGA